MEEEEKKKENPEQDSGNPLAVPEGENQQEPEAEKENEDEKEDEEAAPEPSAEKEDQAARLQELIAEAEARGEIRGRNAKIAELMKEIHDSDGVPHPGTGRGSRFSPRPSNIFDLAREAW